MTIRVGIVGYGNLGRGVELAIRQTPDMALVAIFTRRNPSEINPLTSGVTVQHISEAGAWKENIDVMILCGGSATDLPMQGPEFAKHFNCVDSFDNHKNIPIYFANMDDSAKKSGKVAIISVGWDPGLFSLARAYSEAVLPNGQDYTFWGKGVSQGHSDAIRRVPGVKNGKQYTIPLEEAMNAVRSGEMPTLTARQKHLRECFVVAEEGADLARIEEDIKNMPNYFADYDTIVHFITEEQLQKEHGGIPHGGFVMRSGKTGQDSKHLIEFSLKLDSNPEFTSSVLVAYARAAARLAGDRRSGAFSVLDIPPAYLSYKTGAELRAELL